MVTGSWRYKRFGSLPSYPTEEFVGRQDNLLGILLMDGSFVEEVVEEHIPVRNQPRFAFEIEGVWVHDVLGIH